MFGRRLPVFGSAQTGSKDLRRSTARKTFSEAISSFMDFGEKTALAELSKLPKGTFELAEEQDDGRIYNVKVTISDDAFVVDLRDNPDQDPACTNAIARWGDRVRANGVQVADRPQTHRPTKAPSGLCRC